MQDDSELFRKAKRRLVVNQVEQQEKKVPVQKTETSLEKKTGRKRRLHSDRVENTQWQSDSYRENDFRSVRKERPQPLT